MMYERSVHANSIVRVSLAKFCYFYLSNAGNCSLSPLYQWLDPMNDIQGLR